MNNQYIIYKITNKLNNKKRGISPEMHAKMIKGKKIAFKKRKLQ